MSSHDLFKTAFQYRPQVLIGVSCKQCFSIVFACCVFLLKIKTGVPHTMRLGKKKMNTEFSSVNVTIFRK
jgi:hypothetical protein